MIQITQKCNAYLDEADSARNLIKYHKLIAIAPTAFLVILGLALAVYAHIACLAIVAAGILYIVIINSVLSSAFENKCKAIAEKYSKFYAPSGSVVFTTIVDDNKGYAAACLKGNPLWCWLKTEQLNFVSSSVPTVVNLALKSTTLDKFNAIINSDFGCLCIPVKDVDHYRDGTLVCKYGSEVCKLTFKDDKAFDAFIAKKDFYFITEKKSL